ncbi:MAG: hypothetical protein ACTSRZ_00565 [Promethearchaeota archaeon]
MSKSINRNKKLINEQINKIKQKYHDAIIIDERGIVQIALHEKVNVEFDFRKFPKMPKVKIPPEMEWILGKPTKFLDTLNTWDKKFPKDIINIIKELKDLIDLYKKGDVLISKELILGMLQWAKDMHPKPVHAFLERNKKGIISEFLLSDKGISHVMDFYQGIRPSPRLTGSFHSHPSGSFELSDVELDFFTKYSINVVVAAPYNENSIKCFNSIGKEIKFALV